MPPFNVAVEGFDCDCFALLLSYCLSPFPLGVGATWFLSAFTFFDGLEDDIVDDLSLV